MGITKFPVLITRECRGLVLEAYDPGLDHATTTNQGFAFHYYGGKLHRFPQEWCLPTCGLRQLWKKWHIGDTVNNVPPLRTLTTADVKHLDVLDNPNNEKRCDTRKTFSELRMVCLYIDELAAEKQFDTIAKTEQQLSSFFDEMATVGNALLSRSLRCSHLQWHTAV